MEELSNQKKELREELGLGEDDEEDDEGGHGSELSSDEDEDEDYVEELPMASKAKTQKMRSSVSAEAYGVHNKKEDFVAPIVEKTDEVKNEIISRLKMSFMFMGLNSNELETVASAMSVVEPKKGTVVITEGKDGDDMFVIESGTFRCTKMFEGEFHPTHLKDFKPGDAFGELALLYNAPRAATISTDTKGAKLYRLDRATFNHIVKDASQRKREKYEAFLAQVDLLKSMDSYERGKLADVFKDVEYEPGDFVIQEGEEGSVMYFIFSGDALATHITEGEKSQVLKKYHVGDYFGEKSLLADEPRACNVVAKTKLRVVSIDRYSFKRLLGPVEQILKRNMDQYQAIADETK